MMETPNNSAEQLVGENSTSQGEEDKNDTLTANQPIVAPIADHTVTTDAPAATDTTATDTIATDTTAKPEPDSQGDGADDPIGSARPPFLEPAVELRVHRSYASQKYLDAEAVTLLRAIRQYMLNSNKLIGFLACRSDGTYAEEVAMLDATSHLLIKILDESDSTTPTRTFEEVSREVDIQNWYRGAVTRLQRRLGPESGGLRFPLLFMFPRPMPQHIRQLLPSGRLERGMPCFGPGMHTSRSKFWSADEVAALIRRRGPGNAEQGGKEVGNSGLDGSGWLYDVD